MKKVELKDICGLTYVSRPVFSPDGTKAVFSAARADYEDNDYKKYLYLLSQEEGKPAVRQLTWQGGETCCAFEDSDTILFAAQRGEKDKPEEGCEKTVFYRLSLKGGEAGRAFELPWDVDRLLPLGGGKYIAEAVTDAYPQPEITDKLLKKDRKDYHVIEEVPLWANGSGYVSGKRSALFLCMPGEGVIIRLTENEADVASWDYSGGRIVYAACSFTAVRSLYEVVSVINPETMERKQIIGPDRFTVSAVTLAGSCVTLAMSDMKPWGTGQMHDFYRYDLEKDTLEKVCTPGIPLDSAILTDASYGGGSWIRALGTDVYFIAQSGPYTGLYRLKADNSCETVLDPKQELIIKCFDICDGKAAAVISQNGTIGELYAGTAEEACAAGEPAQDAAWPAACGWTWRRASSFNDEYLGTHEIAKAEYIPFTDCDGVKVDGWILKPEGFDGGARFPAVLEIHGGPRCTYSTGYYHEMQAMVSAGYAVFFCNPRGSEGYGEEYADLRGKYGDIDYKDIMEFTDHVLALFPQIDPERLFASGGSYGGFMCNWIEGHTDRFAAIASQRSVSNWVADFGSSEIGVSFDTNEMAATPWTDMEKMWRQSPLAYANNAKTPILFIHSLCDYNCTIDQGVEMFTAVRYHGVEARMCLFEGENHSLSRSGRPRHRIRRLEEILGWFERHPVRKP